MASSSLARVLHRGLHTSARRHALTKFSMPAMSPTMTEGGIASWKKAEGDSFTAGDVLLEIETDKATIDVEAQEDGILAKILKADGSKAVSVGSTIAILAEEGDDLSKADSLASESSSDAAPKKDSNEGSKPAPAEDQKGADKPAPAADGKAQTLTESAPPPAQSSAPPPKSAPRAGDRIYASPIAKAIALERGVPLGKVKGTGPGGRIVREDVEKYQPEAASAAPAKSSAPASAGAAAAEYTDTPVSSMRRTIGARLLQSKQEIPHYYVTADVNMDKVLKLRQVFNADLAKKDGGAKLSVNDFVVKAVACALADVPEANSAWLGETIRTYKKADICVAVATPTGLITPIIKDAGGKGLASISAEAKALAKKARDGKLQPHEYQGGTFTISNLGMFDVSHFTAIINPPQSCILAVGSTIPTLVPAPEEERGFKTVNVMKVTLSSDHRTVDGAVAARFLKALKGYLEAPLTYML